MCVYVPTTYGCRQRPLSHVYFHQHTRTCTHIYNIHKYITHTNNQQQPTTTKILPQASSSRPPREPPSPWPAKPTGCSSTSACSPSAAACGAWRRWRRGRVCGYTENILVRWLFWTDNVGGLIVFFPNVYVYVYIHIQMLLLRAARAGAMPSTRACPSPTSRRYGLRKNEPIHQNKSNPDTVGHYYTINRPPKITPHHTTRTRPTNSCKTHSPRFRLKTGGRARPLPHPTTRGLRGLRRLTRSGARGAPRRN